MHPWPTARYFDCRPGLPVTQSSTRIVAIDGRSNETIVYAVELLKKVKGRAEVSIAEISAAGNRIHIGKQSILRHVLEDLNESSSSRRHSSLRPYLEARSKPGRAFSLSGKKAYSRRRFEDEKGGESLWSRRRTSRSRPSASSRLWSIGIG